jgi:hypothetical protein
VALRSMGVRRGQEKNWVLGSDRAGLAPGYFVHWSGGFSEATCPHLQIGANNLSVHLTWGEFQMQ